MKGILTCVLILICSLGKAQFIRTTSELDDWQIKLRDKTQKSVMDYYFLLPNSIFDCEQGKKFNKNRRLELITIKDIENGFIEFRGDYKFSMALFKDRINNLDYIAISKNDSGRGSTCGGLNTILQFTPSKGWIYRTDVLPPVEQISQYVKEYYHDPDEVAYCYKLPRYGLIMTLNDDLTDEVICKMKWNGNKFELTE